MMTLVILGPPIAKKRPRFSKFGTYDVQVADTNRVVYEILNQMRKIGVLSPTTDIIEVEMIFHMPIPRSWSQKKRKANHGLWHRKRPDLDNLVKFYLDVMNNVAYKDDALIARIIAEKKYSTQPRTEITIKALEEVPRD